MMCSTKKHFDSGQGAFFMQFQGYKYIKTLGKMPIWALYEVEKFQFS